MMTWFKDFIQRFVVSRARYDRLIWQHSKLKDTLHAEKHVHGILEKCRTDRINQLHEELSEVQKELQHSRDSQIRTEDAILEQINSIFPIRYDRETQWGSFVTRSCPGTNCKEPVQFQVRRRSFTKLVNQVIEHLSKGETHTSELCHDCQPIPVEEFDGRWRVVTEYCQYGGCDASYRDFDTQEKAVQYSADLFEKGIKVNFNGLCGNCRAEYYASCM